MTEFIRARKYNEDEILFNIATHVVAMASVRLCSENRKISVKPTSPLFTIPVCLRSCAFFFLTLIVFALTTSSFGQTSFEKIKFSRVDVDNGLSNSNVTCFLQDSKGFLWVGTMDGLNKYDGYDFIIYRQQPRDTTGLLGNSIASIFEDSHGTLWAATTTHGFYYYNPLKDRFVVVPELSTYGEIVDISEDKNQTLWVTGVMRGQSFVANLNRTTNKWEHHYLFRSDTRVVGIVQDSQDEYWLPVSTIGLFKWNRKTNVLREISDASLNKFIVKIISDDDANLWVATRNGLSKLNTKTETFRHFKTDLKHPEKAPLINVIHAMFHDGYYLWIGTENGGLSRMDIRTETFTNFKVDKSDPSSISDNSIWSVYKDHQSRIWVGTFSKGICVYDKIKNKFGELDISLPNDVVNAIWKDQKQRLWIGTEGGLVMQQGDCVKYYTHQRDNRSTLPNDPVLTIFEDSKNRLWFGTWDGGASCYDEQHDNFINYTHDPSDAFSLSDPNVYSIKEEQATHRLLVSSYFGLNILEDERLHKFEKRFDSVTWNNFLRVVFEDSRGIVWLGSYAGFTRYDLKQNIRTRYLFDALAGSGATINCINEDKEGTIWVGSNKGLHQVQNNILVKTFTTSHGLPNDNVNGILFDDHGNIWLGTNKGISKFNPHTNRFTNYDINDGLVSNEFKRNSCFKSSDGQFYFGGKGVSVFYPDSIKTNPHVPSVFLTGLKIIGKTVNFGAEDSILRHPIAETREITLKPEFNFFTIEYVALNFTASNKNQFAYKLEGFDNDWINAGSQRFATFTNLDPGTYVFRVKASNNDGLWNEKGTSIIIHVLPFWWETWWFKIILVISLVSGVILVFILRTRRMRRISVELELAVNQKTKELQETNQALLKREAEIEEQNRMLTLQGEKMIAKNVELVSSQRELSVKSDLLLQQNEELTKAQKTIEQHNMSIAQQNENLEKEVAKRTEELVQYNQQLEQFAFISAHNLRAPVARVLGLGQLLELAQSNPEEKELIYPKLIYATKELDGVVKDFNSILAIKRSDDTYITKVDLNDEILMIQSNLKAEIANTQTKIISDFSQVCSISTVKSSLDSILFHLVSNAIKFRHPDRIPVIHIKTEMAGNEICLSVSDNGLGINLSRYRDKLFTLYGRFHFHIQGKGMGLYIVKTQLATLGGRIEVDSEEEVGSTFRTYFKSQS